MSKSFFSTLQAKLESFHEVEPVDSTGKNPFISILQNYSDINKDDLALIAAKLGLIVKIIYSDLEVSTEELDTLIDITGNYLKYKANAIGENEEQIKKLLREKYKEGMTSEESIKLALSIFKEVQGENFNQKNFDIGIIENGKMKRSTGRNFI